MNQKTKFLEDVLTLIEKYGVEFECRDHWEGYADMRCALKVQTDKLSGDCVEYPKNNFKFYNRAQLHALLPDHVKSCGPIVDVDLVFEIHCA